MRKTFQLAIVLSLFVLLVCSCVVPAFIHVKQGDRYAGQGNTEQAIAEYSKAIEISPGLAEAYSGRGLIYFGKREWTGAIDDLSKSTDLNPKLTVDISPKLAAAYNIRGHNYNTQGQYDLAVTDLTKAIELDPSSATARIYADRGKAYLELGETALAKNDYNRAIELDPTLLTGQDLPDIMWLGSSKVKTVSMDIDTLTTWLSGDIVSDSCRFPATARSVYDYANKKMKLEIDSNSYGVGRDGQILQEIFVEYYVINGSEYTHMFTEDSEIDWWYKFGSSVQLWEENDQFYRQRDLMKTALCSTLIGSEEIDGGNCYVILAKPNVTELNKLLLSLRPQTMIDFNKVDLSELLNTIEVKEWITKDEYLTVKMEMNILGIPAQDIDISNKCIDKVNIKIQMKFGGFNKPVAIELPAEASASTAKK